MYDANAMHNIKNHIDVKVTTPDFISIFDNPDYKYKTDK